jgi:hypothetical protein
MIAWLMPAAFAAMALLAGPVIVHLLARRNARRVVFPATRFVRPAQAAAIRLRRPTDITLLIVRLAIVAAAVLAAAQPLLITRWNLSAWNARISRSVIVDTTTASAGDQASRLADVEMASAFATIRIDTADLADGLARGAQWLRTRAPSRREVVVISDFRRDAIDRQRLAIIPAQAGVRFVRAGALPAARTVTLPAVEGWRGRGWQPTIAVDANATRVAWIPQGSTGTSADWLKVASAPAEVAAAERARRAALSFGVPAGDDTHKVVVAFAGAETATPAGQAVGVPWMAAAAQALRSSTLLHDASVDVAVTDRGGVLAVSAPITASSPLAAAVLRAALLSVRPATIAGRALETAAIPDRELSQWRRDPAAVTRPSIEELRTGTAIASDARWLWGTALALLGLESWLRRPRRGVAARQVQADAA